MHLVYRAIEKEPVPSTLPANLVPPSKRSSASSGLDRVLPGNCFKYVLFFKYMLHAETF